MSKVEKMEKEFLEIIRFYPENADIYNDYAIFLCRYKNDYKKALGLIKRALLLNPDNKIYRYNYNRILRKTGMKFNMYHNFLVLVIVGIMAWLSANGYHNFLNMFLLFVVAQIVMNYQKNLLKN